MISSSNTQGTLPMPGLSSVDWTPTRAAGLARLTAFVPSAGRAYARDRNVDRGPDDRSNVSALSPWLRRRMITEDEVVAAVLARHDAAAAEKFIQEVYWRTYWKGWLEMRPSVLVRFEQDRDALAAAWKDNRFLARALRAETGIAPFDAWVHELITYGWLHNHARMWFASIWIFTLRLPWQLGAAFFYDHLLDADPASNTLSWRWVAGLHTQGKHYLARASNIRDNTLGRFDPEGQLDERASPLTEDTSPPAPAPIPPGERPREKRVALLLTEEDLHPESWAFAADAAACAALAPPSPNVPEGPAHRFSQGALQDALVRAGVHFGRPGDCLSPQSVLGWAKGTGAAEIITGYAPAGPVSQSLALIAQGLHGQGQRLVRLQRPWDTMAWLHARAGFFKIKAQIPVLLRQVTAG